MPFPSLGEYVDIVDRAAPLLLDTAFRSVAVLGLTGLGVLAMRRASAAARHWAWLLGVTGLLLLPLLSATLPDWRVLPRVDLPQLVASPAVTTSEQSVSVPPPTEHVAASIPVATESNVAITDQQVAASAKVAAVSQPPSATPSVGAHAPAPTPILPALPWTTWLVLIWLAGSLFVLGQIVLGYLSLWVLRRRCARVDQGELPQMLNHLCNLLQIDRKVELLSSPLRTMPMTWGLLRARLLLPDQAADWTPEQVRAVLLHELGHVRRRDCLTQLVAQLACALYWFNPIVWFAWGRMQVERERACDDLVLNTGARASSYAEHLLHSASAMPVLRFIGPAVAMARPSTLEERLRAILDGQRNRGALTVRAAAATILLLLAALIPVAALQGQQNPAADPAPTPAQPAANSGDARLSLEERMRQRRLEASADAPLPPTPATPEQSLICPVDAIIYDVRMPGNKIGQLDVESLTRFAATSESFEKALSDLGTVVPLYRLNQTVRLAQDTITVGNSAPYVAGVRYTRGGQAMNTVLYSNVGAVLNILGKARADQSMDVDLILQVTSLTESTTEISAGLKAQMFRNSKMAHRGTIKPNQPFVIVNATVDASGQTLAYIIRGTLGAPQSTAAPKGE